MTPPTGEQLNRRYWELKGWKEGVDPEKFTQYPALHLDLNLAIAEADREFEQWAHEKDGNERIVRAWLKPVGQPHDVFRATGAHALSIAILHALIAKLEPNPVEGKR